MKSKKKKRQDDFQKVKLKVGKKKPKADNSTNTNFRTKGINLSEQLRKDTSGPTTHRQLSINVSPPTLSKSMFHLSDRNTTLCFNNINNIYCLLPFSAPYRTSCLSCIITMPTLNMVPCWAYESCCLLIHHC